MSWLIIIYDFFYVFHFHFHFQAAFDAGVACVEDHANEIHVVTGTHFMLTTRFKTIITTFECDKYNEETSGEDEI